MSDRAATSGPAHHGFGLSSIDALLLLMVVIWGSNFAVIKVAIRQIPPQGFNALRLIIATCLFLGALALNRRDRGRTARGTPPPRAGSLTRPDWLVVIGLGLVGHFAYQLLFMGGLARTSVANSSLIMSATPVAVALLNAAFGLEPIDARHWAGALLSMAGIYLVAGAGAGLAHTSVAGDLMMVGAVVCWAVYTIGARSILVRHSPLVVTGYSMAVGTACYVPFALPDLVQLAWADVLPAAWVGLVFSAVFALCVAYLIWYTAVQRIGSAKTSVYSNMVPIAAVATAVVWLGEPLTPLTVGGAAAILAGVALTRMGRGVRAPIPPEE